ncbi:retrovirus-related pol polyprotein from transposon TNT 1-94 [Tanacetum coccineum]
MNGQSKAIVQFVEKKLGTVRFGNDQFALILGYGDLVQGNIMINRVFYVEGLNHNLFSIGQFCDAELEVTFWKSTCFVRDLQGNDLLTGNRGSNLYIISLEETTSSIPICFMAKASPTQACKAKRSSFKTKVVPSSKGRLNLLHMDLCGPMRDETPEVLKDFLKMIQQNLQAQVITVRTDRGTKFLNKTLHAYFKEEGIENQTSIPRTPEQNDAVERQNPDTTDPSQQELDLLFGPLYDDFFTAGTSSVNKSSSPTDNSKQQDTPSTTNIQSSTEPTTPTTNVNAMENNDNQTEDTQFQQDEFINPFCTPVQEIA